MKKLKYISIPLLAFIMFFTTSCEEFLDVNENPTQIREANLESLLPTILESTSDLHNKTALTAGRVTHQLDHVFGYYSEFRMESTWEEIYLKILNNADVVNELGTELKSPHYNGIAHVVQAVSIAMLADVYEDAPFSNALAGSEILKPTYDTQESLYNAAMSYLNDGIQFLESENTGYEPGSDDMIYGGDIDKWIRLAHSLKARYMIHLSNKSTVNWNAILAEVDLGMTSNDDNFSFYYNGGENKNPLHTGVALANLTGNFTYTHGKFLIDLMNGASYGVTDPRLPFIAGLEDGETEYMGLASYDDEAPAYTTAIDQNTWYGKADAPVVMMSFAEVKLIEAEAALNVDAGRAYTAYMEAISANMDMLGVSSGDKTAYMEDPAVALGGTTDLEHIMKEKMIALFMNTESWTDIRRHHFDDTIFKGFVIMEYLGRTEPGQRALHPTTELTRNKENESAFSKDFTEVMWRDKQ